MSQTRVVTAFFVSSSLATRTIFEKPVTTEKARGYGLFSCFEQYQYWTKLDTNTHTKYTLSTHLVHTKLARSVKQE